MSRGVGAVLAVTGFLACPCHLVVTLPLAIGVLAGTAAGAFLAANTGLVMLAASVYFVGGLGVGWYLLTRQTRRAVHTVGSSSSPACCLPAVDGGSHSHAAAGQPMANDEHAVPARY